MSNELLTIVPHDNLQFHLEPNKRISCSVYLINKTDNHVAFKFKVMLTNEKKYAVKPNAGVVPPRSSLQVLVIMRAQKEALPVSTKCNDKFLFQSVVSRAPSMNVTPGMFCKEAGHRVYKTKLGVMYVAPPVHDGSEDNVEGSVREPKARDFSELHTVLGKTLLCCPSSPLLLRYLMCCPIYSHLLRSLTESHASSDSDPFDMLLPSFTTKGINMPEHQVFINFRGAELRNTFVGFLAKAMRLEKINVFTDEVEVKGTTLSSLFTRIEESNVAVAILSERYTESSWCLDELVKMIERMKQGKLVVVPVFYKLDPSACRKLYGSFGDNFRKLVWEHRSEPERIEKWEQALSSVFKILGLKLDPGRNESKFVDLIVEEVKKVLIKIFTEKRKLGTLPSELTKRLKKIDENLYTTPTF